MNLMEASCPVGAVGGAVTAGWLGYVWLGWGGGVVGTPVGAVVGWFLAPFAIFLLFLFAAVWELGFVGAWKELFTSLKKRRPPNDGSPPGQTNDPPRSGDGL